MNGKQMIFVWRIIALFAVMFAVILALSKNKTIDEYKEENDALRMENAHMLAELEELTERMEGKPSVSGGVNADTYTESSVTEEKKRVDREQIEKSTYTFFQGPWAWKQRLPWSGKWGKEYYDGASFGGFGCGLVCMANIYSTLTEYEASPVDLYEYAKQTTEYGGGGAIDWKYMEQTLTSLGMKCELHKKPESYKEFRQSVAEGECSIVLVWSYECSTYWQDNDGHYVTVFGYDDETEEVFLADSGDPSHNRQWISLDKVYASLKSISDWQYLNILSYDSSQCEWKNEAAGGKWIRPEEF